MTGGRRRPRVCGWPCARHVAVCTLRANFHRVHAFSNLHFQGFAFRPPGAVNTGLSPQLSVLAARCRHFPFESPTLCFPSTPRAAEVPIRWNQSNGVKRLPSRLNQSPDKPITPEANHVHERVRNRSAFAVLDWFEPVTANTQMKTRAVTIHILVILLDYLHGIRSSAVFRLCAKRDVKSPPRPLSRVALGTVNHSTLRRKHDQ